MTEALQSVVVGNALGDDLLQAQIQGGMVTMQLGQAQGETVGRVGATVQFALVPCGLEDSQAGALGSAEIGIGLAR
ncbi:hypothetical protein D9M68_905700 [compost metagenome]